MEGTLGSGGRGVLCRGYPGQSQGRGMLGGLPCSTGVTLLDKIESTCTIVSNDTLHRSDHRYGHGHGPLRPPPHPRRPPRSGRSERNLTRFQGDKYQVWGYQATRFGEKMPSRNLPRDTKTQDMLGAGMRESLAAKRHCHGCGAWQRLRGSVGSRHFSFSISIRAKKVENPVIGNWPNPGQLE
jgi:hypothetical protein